MKQSLRGIPFTSDACTLPVFDPETAKLIKIKMGLPDSILREIKEAVTKDGIPLEIALRVATSNPADILKLAGKGYIQANFDADILILDADFKIVHLMANGKMVKLGSNIHIY